MYDPIIFTNPLSIKSLIIRGKELIDNEAIIENIDELCEVLYSKKYMLIDYFSIGIVLDDKEYLLSELPQVILGYNPNYSNLPVFLYKLSRNINWNNENECLDGIMMLLSEFYSNIDDKKCNGNDKVKDIDFIIQHFIYPPIRDEYIFDKNDKNNIIKVVSTHDLYKIFDRC